ncbi:MAG TPA: hypothetical protein VJC21_00750 [Candidatus Nanoarchaeia archaeon]|nr:hypothetical protein [Candidatus Nanoarchaeia archaeon]
MIPMAAAPQNGASLQDFSLPRFYAWLKGVEGKVNTLLREMDLLKNDFMKKIGGQKQDLGALNTEFLDLKHEQERLSQKMDLVVNELKRTAGKEELLVLQKYIDLWNPLHFATQGDVERLVEAKLAGMRQAFHKPVHPHTPAHPVSHFAQHPVSEPHRLAVHTLPPHPQRHHSAKKRPAAPVHQAHHASGKHDFKAKKSKKHK